MTMHLIANQYTGVQATLIILGVLVAITLLLLVVARRRWYPVSVIGSIMFCLTLCPDVHLTVDWAGINLEIGSLESWIGWVAAAAILGLATAQCIALWKSPPAWPMRRNPHPAADLALQTRRDIFNRLPNQFRVLKLEHLERNRELEPVAGQMGLSVEEATLLYTLYLMIEHEFLALEDEGQDVDDQDG